MSKKDFDKDYFWNDLRNNYNKMKNTKCMAEYYEGVCWGMAACAYNIDLISTNTFKLISRLLQANCRKRLNIL